MTQERWLPVSVLGYEHLYEVSSHGHVRSLPRSTGSGVRGGQLLKLVPKNKYGHLKVTLSNEGCRVTYDVHWLVSRAFLGAPPPGQEARHGTTLVSDNSVDNLSYGTSADNQRDRVRDGTDQRGEHSAKAKLTWAIAREIRRRRAAGERGSDLAREFHTTQSTVWQIASNQQWKVEHDPRVDHSVASLDASIR